MKINQSFSTLVWANKSKVKNGLIPIYIRITIDSKRVEISTKKWVAVNNWSAPLQRAKGKDEESRKVNQYINLVVGEIEKIILKLSLEKKKATPQLVKEILVFDESKTSKPKHKTICEAFDYHNLKMEETLKVGKVCDKTLLRYKITKNKVVAFMEKQYKVSDMELPAIRLRFVTEFEHYLLTTDKLQSNTAHKYIKNLKKIMNMAVGLDWIPSNPLNQFKCSYQSPDREILNREELAVVQFKKLGIPRLEEVRDVF